jgi:tRNA nucleotidyltransferase (CCA-adding enzyme)
LKENIDDFIKKWKNDPKATKKPYEKNGRVYVEIKRDFIDIKDVLSNQIKNLSLGKHIDPIVKHKYVVLKTEDLIKNDLKIFWTEYLDKKMSWER